MNSDPRPLTFDDVYGDGADECGMLARYSHQIRLLEAKARELTKDNERLRARVAELEGARK